MSVLQRQHRTKGGRLFLCENNGTILSESRRGLLAASPDNLTPSDLDRQRHPPPKRSKSPHFSDRRVISTCNNGVYDEAVLYKQAEYGFAQVFVRMNYLLRFRAFGWQRNPLRVYFVPRSADVESRPAPG